MDATSGDLQKLADMAPGWELARILDGIDKDRLDRFDLLHVLIAEFRLEAWLGARQLETMNQIMHTPDDPPDDDSGARTASPVDAAADEIRVALSWTRKRADREAHVAMEAAQRFPATMAALSEGRIHKHLVHALVDGTNHLTLEQARQVEAHVLSAIDEASQGCFGMGGLTSSQVQSRIRRQALAVDPDSSAKRTAKAVKSRRLEGWTNDDGTADLAGRNLPLDKAAMAKDRIDSLARRIKATGEAKGRTMDQLRADLFVGLLAGTIPNHVPPDGATAAAADGPAAGMPEGKVPAAAGMPEGKVPAAAGMPEGNLPASLAADACDGGRQEGDEIAASDAEVVRRAKRTGGLELVISAETLMGLQEEPGELVGWGPIGADIARQLASQLKDAPWRWTAVDPSTGYVIGHGSTRRRPLAELDSFVRSRDRYCRGKGCRTPARHADLDHTQDYVKGGLTEEFNLGPGCRHDHRLKHEAGWTLQQPRPGLFQWTAPSGHQYLVRPPRLREPVPDHDLEWAPNWRQLLEDRIRQARQGSTPPSPTLPTEPEPPPPF